MGKKKDILTIVEEQRIRLIRYLYCDPAGVIPVSYTHLTLPTILRV